MIVRISTEGQYELGEDKKEELNRLDNEVVTACEGSDEQTFRSSFELLLDFVRTQGQRVGQDDLVASDLILPPPDVSLEEAREEFSGEGLIPG